MRNEFSFDYHNEYRKGFLHKRTATVTYRGVTRLLSQHKFEALKRAINNIERLPAEKRDRYWLELEKGWTK